MSEQDELHRRQDEWRARARKEREQQREATAPAAPPPEVAEAYRRRDEARAREEAKQAKQHRRFLVLKKECPTCVLDSDKERACEFRGADHDCRHQRELVARFLAAELPNLFERHARGLKLPPSLAHVPRLTWKIEDLYQLWRLDGGTNWSRLPDPVERLYARGVPVRHAVGALKEPRLTDATKLVLELVDGGGGDLIVLSGDNGVGKSHSAAIAMVKDGFSGLWLPATQFEDPESAKGMQDNEDEEQLADDSPEGCPLLVIDDAGTEYSPRGYASLRIANLVAAREAAMLATIITTNLTAPEFKERYGARLASRINGDKLGWRHIPGPDLRKEQHLRVVNG